VANRPKEDSLVRAQVLKAAVRKRFAGALVALAAEVVFASIEADGSRIGGQQIVAAPGPQGILMSGESLEFCLRAAPPPPNEVAAESANTDRDPRRAPARIIAL